jgi:RES domain-containing protein
VVYCSSTLALAALETLVHLGPDAARLAFVSFEIGIPPEVAIERLDKPPRGWRVEPPGPASVAAGSAWIAAGRTAVLEVPSALVPSEFNALLNPAHADFGKLRITRPQPFPFDPRLWK